MLTTIYACPVCREPLSKQDLTWKCINNHCFDEHKKGYLNLLLAQNKRSKSPGDDSNMVISRRRFLEDHNYQPLALHIADQLRARLSAKMTVLDAGCGEGYYTELLASHNPDLNFYGLDISKPAIVAASKHKNIAWSVASSSHLPFVDGSVDAIVSIFSRVDAEPFYKVLKANGLVCMVAPDHDHLMGLRQLIYTEVRPYDTSKHHDYFDNRFTLIDEQRLEVPLNLATNQSVLDLIGMTPHAHRLSTETRAKLEQVTQLDDCACFKVYWFQKQGT